MAAEAVFPLCPRENFMEVAHDVFNFTTADENVSDSPLEGKV